MLATSDLLRNADLAQELVRFTQARQLNNPYRPVRMQFYPVVEWVESLRTVAGPVASKPLDELIVEMRATPRERMVMGRYLGHLSAQIEAVWTDAYARQSNPLPRISECCL